VLVEQPQLVKVMLVVLLELLVTMQVVVVVQVRSVLAALTPFQVLVAQVALV
jgi:hypothetical protein